MLATLMLPPLIGLLLRLPRFDLVLRILWQFLNYFNA